MNSIIQASLQRSNSLEAPGRAFWNAAFPMLMQYLLVAVRLAGFIALRWRRSSRRGEAAHACNAWSGHRRDDPKTTGARALNAGLPLFFVESCARRYRKPASSNANYFRRTDRVYIHEF